MLVVTAASLLTRVAAAVRAKAGHCPSRILTFHVQFIFLRAWVAQSGVQRMSSPRYSLSNAVCTCLDLAIGTVVAARGLRVIVRIVSFDCNLSRFCR